MHLFSVKKVHDCLRQMLPYSLEISGVIFKKSNLTTTVGLFSYSHNISYFTPIRMLRDHFQRNVGTFISNENAFLNPQVVLKDEKISYSIEEISPEVVNSYFLISFPGNKLPYGRVDNNNNTLKVTNSLSFCSSCLSLLHVDCPLLKSLNPRKKSKK